MKEYRFKNLNIKHDGQDFLVNGTAQYIIEDFDEDGKEAGFESAVLFDAIGKDGFITSKEVLEHLANSALIVLNNDSHLCRVLGNKI
jgi:H2-forming N5,N10-methylenetetrahydromethanopterin dehydrogenase-like enzyme